MHARYPLRTHAEPVDHLALDEVRIREEVNALIECSRQVALEMRDPLGRVPLGIEKNDRSWKVATVGRSLGSGSPFGSWYRS